MIASQRSHDRRSLFAGFAEDGGCGDEDVAAGGADVACVGGGDAAVHLEALGGFEALADDAGFVEDGGDEGLA